MNVKRMLALLLISAALTAFISGCGAKQEGSPAPTAEGTQAAAVQTADNTQAADDTQAAESTQQADGGYCADYRLWSMLETDGTLYKAYENVLYFSDKDYKDWMPLCPKPNCSHNDKDCDAWLGGTSGLWIYGDHIYFIENAYSADEDAVRRFTEAELWRMRFDGTAHEKVCRLPMPEAKAFKAFENAWSSIWQGKYAIVFYTAFKDTDHEVSEFYGYAMDLDTLETVPLTYLDLPYEPERGFSALYGSGDELLILNMYYPDDVPEDELTLADRIFTLERLDCATGEVRHIGALEKHLYWSEGQMSFSDGRLTYMTWDGGDSIDFWQMDLETGENSFKANYPAGEPHPHNYDAETGLWFASFVNKRPELIEKTKPIWGLYFYNADFELVDSVLFADLPEEDYDEVIEIMVSTRSRGFIFGNGAVIWVDEFGNKHVEYPLGGTVPGWYIDKADIGTGRLGWKRWEP